MSIVLQHIRGLTSFVGDPDDAHLPPYGNALARSQLAGRLRRSRLEADQLRELRRVCLRQGLSLATPQVNASDLLIAQQIRAIFDSRVPVRSRSFGVHAPIEEPRHKLAPVRMAAPSGAAVAVTQTDAAPARARRPATRPQAAPVFAADESAQSRALKTASANGTPFCEECTRNG